MYLNWLCSLGYFPLTRTSVSDLAYVLHVKNKKGQFFLFKTIIYGPALIHTIFWSQ